MTNNYHIAASYHPSCLSRGSLDLWGWHRHEVQGRQRWLDHSLVLECSFAQFARSSIGVALRRPGSCPGRHRPCSSDHRIVDMSCCIRSVDCMKYCCNMLVGRRSRNRGERFEFSFQPR